MHAPRLLYYFITDRRGQDLVEYALLCGFVATVAAAFLPPAFVPVVSTIMSKTTSVLSRFA